MHPPEVEKSLALQLFAQAILEEKALLVEGLWESPKAALLALIHQTCKQPIVVITGGVSEERLFADCTYFGLSQVVDFPAWETLPGEDIAPSSDIVGKRLQILAELASEILPRIIVCPLQACLQKLPPPSLVQKTCRHVKKGDEVSFSSFQEQLTSLGYQRMAVASDKGEFAVRGGIIDLFPLSATDPVRIEFFGDTVEAIRIYDPISQKSIEKKESFFLAPASETALLESTEELSSLLDYVGQDACIVFDNLVALEDRYVAIKNLPGAKSRLFSSLEEFFTLAKSHRHLYFTETTIEELDAKERYSPAGRGFYSGKHPFQPIEFEIADLHIQAKRWQHPFVPILDYFSTEEHPLGSIQELPSSLSRFPKTSFHWLVGSESEKKGLQERLTHECEKSPDDMRFELGYLSNGFVLPDLAFALIPMTEFTHRYKVRRQKWRTTYHAPAAEFHELGPGDIVVHFHHGIGRYLGSEKRTNHLGQMSEFLTIEYAEGGKLYVPIQQAYLVSRYIGANETSPSFHVIGGKQWLRSKAQAEKAIVGYAHDLLRLHAERTVHGGFACPDDTSDMISFEEEFPYAETEDQLRAIADVKQDMRAAKAMDRLVCGDVGYGKTEVAMRAAFKAVADGKKQVAVLVPTTVLALQHYENFKGRMANFPVQIGIVSRFQTTKENKTTLHEVEEGKVDILIGTHRIISKDVRFKDLGLIIIDEEQRFGVRAKEHLKMLKTGVDCLTLSATPIPRTLYMSLVGAREISVINTPPHDRLPIKSMIVERESTTIHNALLRELARDGQAFFIHNRVESIFKIRDELQALLPEARIVVGHGQMPADEIDRVFHAFKSGEADVLLATTIIENGIDIPNANTILIDHADKFGIADLYQMRGRVGRWNRPAYSYFLIPRHKPLGEIARKRLFALVEASGYGGGMKIAMRDLEIRGAGDILGTQQSGQMASIGFHLYCKLLKRAIDALHKKVVPDFCETKMEFSYDARIPEDYIAEPSLRMEIYHRLGETTNTEELQQLMSELQDRFGRHPSPVLWLKALTLIKITASKKRIVHMKFDTHTLSMEQQKGKESRKLLYPLQRSKTPLDLENQVLLLLSKI